MYVPQNNIVVNQRGISEVFTGLNVGFFYDTGHQAAGADGGGEGTDRQEGPGGGGGTEAGHHQHAAGLPQALRDGLQKGTALIGCSLVISLLLRLIFRVLGLLLGCKMAYWDVGLVV